MINWKKILACANFAIAVVIWLATLFDVNDVTKYMIPLYWYFVLLYWGKVKGDVK